MIGFAGTLKNFAVEMEVEYRRLALACHEWMDLLLETVLHLKGRRIEQMTQRQKIGRMKMDQTFAVIQWEQTEALQRWKIERSGKIEPGCMTGKTQTG